MLVHVDDFGRLSELVLMRAQFMFQTLMRVVGGKGAEGGEVELPRGPQDLFYRSD